MAPVSASCVPGLFGSCCPFAIGGSIWAVVVNALDGECSRWSTPHREKEVHKTRSPLVTYVDAPPPIVGVRGITGLVTPLDHESPDSIFWCLRKPVCPHDVAEYVLKKTSTTLRRTTTCQAGSAQHDGVSAAALTKPSPGVVIRGLLFNHNQSSNVKTNELRMFHTLYSLVNTEIMVV
jgi:hypothetical protein